VLISANLSYLAYNAHLYDRIYRGVSILGADVGGLTPADALRVLDEQFSASRLPDVALQVDGQTTYVSMSDLGGRLDVVDAVAKAFALGRSGTLLPDMATRVRLLWQGYDVVPSFVLDDAAAELALRPLARQQVIPARNTRLVIKGFDAHVQQAEAGREIDLAATIGTVESAVSAAFGQSGWHEQARMPELLRGAQRGGDPAASVPLVVDLTLAQTALPLGDVSVAEHAVTTLLGSPLTLSWVEPGAKSVRTWLVDQATLSSWLTLTPADASDAGYVHLDHDAITTFVGGLASEIDRPAVTGRFNYDAASGELRVIKAEQAGYALDIGSTVEAIEMAAFAADRTVELPVEIELPMVSEADLRALLPLDLLGEGTTQFVGSTPSRQANIVTAARAFDGVVVPAGGTFSFLAILGPVNRGTGYEESWVILGNRTELGPGGGVCQVATTCFRAAFWSGLPIIERHPHAYRVSWYEPPIGLDASVYEPYVDLQFANDYAYPFVISVAIDEQAQKLAFRFYGRSDGRRVSMTEPATSNPKPAPEPVYEEDNTLAAGQQVQVERAHDGLDVSLTRTVTWPDGTTDEYLLTTQYAAWPARFKVPPAASGPTQ